MTEPGRLAGSKESIIAYVEELKADRDSARVALHTLISGVELVPMTSPADAVKAVAEYENRIATLDKLIAQYEVELAAGRYVD